MSHGKERKEKNCLNCGAEVVGRYCHKCGQENIETHETLWNLVQHFAYDITHFDGKFFATLRYLMFRPGFLSAEYWRGRRSAYLHPVRLYVFSSALFFFIVIAMGTGEKLREDSKQIAELKEAKHALELAVKEAKDSILKQTATDSLNVVEEKINKLKANHSIMLSTDETDGKPKEKYYPLSIGNDSLNSLQAYENSQKALPPGKRDNFINRYVKERLIHVNTKYENRFNEFTERFVEKFMHSLPLMMLLAMPFIAMFLKLFYWNKKEYTYVNHGILTIHNFVAVYSFLLISYAFNKLQEVTQWSIFTWVSTLIVLAMFYYVYKSFRNFYHQKRFITLVKFFTLSLLVLVLMGVLSVLFVMNSILNA